MSSGINPVHKQLIALALVLPLLLSGCASENSALDDSNLSSDPAATDTAVEPSNPQSSVVASDPCDVLDQMQASLSTAVTDLIANPDLVTAFETEFDNQVILLNDLIESLQGDTAEQKKLQADIDAAVTAKNDAVQKFNDAQLEDNILSKTLGMADAALSARDAVTAAEQVLVDLNGQLQCQM
jgi:hypothetical protein